MNSKYAEVLNTFQNSKLEQVPAYPNDAILQALDQINKSYNELKELRKSMQQQTEMNQQQKIFLKGKMVVKIDTIYRLKRFLLICHQSRCNRIQQQFWKFGGEVKNSQLPNLSTPQRKYLLDYKNLVNNYIQDVGLEITMDMKPPIDTHILVRVVKDCGQIVELGVTFEKNSVHYIKRKLVQKLIQRGDVIQIS